MDDNKLIKFALDAGAMMLSGGAETQRVQDTMYRILSTGHSAGVAAVALGAYIIVSIPSEKEGSLTLTRWVRRRSENFEIICAVNDISRDFVSGEISLEEAEERLRETSRIEGFAPWLNILATGIACGGFTMVLNGSVTDGLASVLIGAVTGSIAAFLSKRKIPKFFTCLAGGLVAGAGAMLFQRLIPTAGAEMIIVGGIMPFLPGITMTNSIRDIIEENYITGTSKLAEAFLAAFAIACGTGLGVSMFM